MYNNRRVGWSRRRRLRLTRTIAVASALLAVGIYAAISSTSSSAPSASTRAGVRAAHINSTSSVPRATIPTAATIPPARRIPAGPPADERRLTEVASIGGPISPKSVDATGTGLVFAQNMMYRHTVTVYNSAGNLLKDHPGQREYGCFRLSWPSRLTRGAPVEAAFSPDARYAYVSNYSMYGAGMGPEG